MENLMKKVFGITITLVIVIGFFMLNMPKLDTVSADIGVGSWVIPGSTETVVNVNVDDEIKSAPAWLQQVSEAIKIDKASKICYTFPQGRYGWAPQIRQYKDGKWLKIATTSEYPFSEEAPRYACANAPAAGTYILFAYYHGISEVTPETEPAFDCSTIVWSYKGDSNLAIRVYSTSIEIIGAVTGVPSTTTSISYEITQSNLSSFKDMRGSGFLDPDNKISFSIKEDTTGLESLTIQFTESTHNCKSTSVYLPD
jgi:hypothetical protein